MATSHNHVLPIPQPIIVVRSFQLVVAVVILGLAAYGITYFSFDGIDLTLFSALATIIIAVYVIVATVSAPALYNYWAILGLDIFAIIFWIISFSLLAYEVGAYSVNTTYSYTYCYYGYCFKNKRDSGITKRTTDLYTYRNAMAAASGLGGLEFILFAVTLVFTSIFLHRHRKAGGHCMPHNPEAAAPMQQQPPYVQSTQPVHQQPAPVYQQQPVQPQQEQPYPPPGTYQQSGQ